MTVFRALHESGCFVLPNPWDIGSARFLEQLGFKALATSSAGFAFTRGLPDSPWAVTRDAMLGHVREIAAATPLPVNADFQSGYAHDPAGVAENVALCARTGVAGLSIEDATGNQASPLYERALAIERIRAARAAIDESGSNVLLTARCEAWLVGDAEPQKTAIDRLVAFAEVGADCLYAPGVRDLATIATLVKAVAPRPVNALLLPGMTLAQLAEAGVRRVSVGSALARVAWGAFMKAGRTLREEGRLEEASASFAELNALFKL